jgi:outer membrane protein assembly factor BamE
MIRRNSLLRTILIVIGALCLTTGCVYRITIQQGNFLEDKDIDQIAVGMTRTQVKYLLGTPMVADPFQSSRWDYVYYLKKGRLSSATERHFIVFFQGDKVAGIERPLPTTKG